MLATNGKIIISPKNDFELLDESIQEIEALIHATTDQKKLKFKLKEEPFHHYVVPSGLDVIHLLEIASNVTEMQHRSINDDMMTLLTTRTKEIKHMFTQDEMVEVGEALVDLIDQKEALEQEKKSYTKSLNDQIAEVELKMKEKADMHKQGYENRKVNVTVKIDFAAGEKYFCDPETGECLLSEELTAEDRQLKIEYTPNPFFEDPDDFAKPEENV